MAWTQTQIDDLETAIAGGVTEVEVNERKVKYQSIGAMIKLLNMMKSDVAGNSGNGGITKQQVDFTT